MNTDAIDRLADLRAALDAGQIKTLRPFTQIAQYCDKGFFYVTLYLSGLTGNSQHVMTTRLYCGGSNKQILPLEKQLELASSRFEAGLSERNEDGRIRIDTIKEWLA